MRGSDLGAALAAWPLLTAAAAPDGGLWWLGALPLAAGAYWALRRRQRPARARADRQAHLAQLKAKHGRLLAAVAQLDGQLNGDAPGQPASAPAAGAGAWPQGAPAPRAGPQRSAAHEDLERRVVALRTEALALRDELAIAEQDLAAGPLRTPEADGVLAAVARRLGPLAAELAIAVARMAALAEDQADVRSRADAARDRLRALRGRAVGDNGLAMLGDRLDAAVRLTGDAPAAARAGVEAVERALGRLEERAIVGKPAITWAAGPPAEAPPADVRNGPSSHLTQN